MKRGPAPQRRFPIDAIEMWIVENCAPGTRHQAAAEHAYGGRPSALRISELVGCHRGQVSQWRRTGVPLYAADRAAIALGVHPSAIWPGWVDALVPA